LHGSRCFQELVKQSPWLLADAMSAPVVVDLMKSMAAMPAYRLRLGIDVYEDPEQLMNVLQPALSFAPSSLTEMCAS
jgi:hypothetical protein